MWIPDNREKIIIYDKSKISDSSLPFIENTLLPFFVFLFGKNYFELTVDIYFLEGGIESFEQSYPFLCTRHPNYQENLVYPSQITPYLFLSSQVSSIPKRNPYLFNFTFFSSCVLQLNKF